MKKIIILVLAVLSITSLSAYDIDKYRVSLGILPGITGFENAYLTDRIVSGEGTTSEEAYMNFSDSNSDSSASLAVAIGKTISTDSTLWGELTFSAGDATTAMLSAAYQYKISKPTKNMSISVLPRIGFVSITQDMGTVPVFDGQINTAQGDFNSGDDISMSMSGLFMGLSLELNYQIDNKLEIFANIGYGIGMMGDPKVSISDTELEGQIFAKNCTGTSSTNLECSGYFDPFEDVQGLTGLTFQLGAEF